MATFRYFLSFLLEPIGYFLLCWAVVIILKTSKEVRFKVLLAFLVLIFCSLVNMMMLKKGSHNAYLYSLIYLFIGVGWGLYFRFLLVAPLKKIIALVVVVATLVYYVVANFVFEPPTVFDSDGYVLVSSGLLLLVFLFYHQLMNNVKVEPLSLNFDFWISSALLIYCLGAFGIFLTYNHFTHQVLQEEFSTFRNREILTYLWGVHNVLLFLASLLTWAGALWIVYRRKSTSS